jgi:hypothetical protein
MSEKAVEDLNQSMHDFNESPITPGGTLLPVEEPPKSIRDILLHMKQMQEDTSREHLSQMRQLLAQEEIGANLSIKAFDWMACKPRKLFHPVSSSQLPSASEADLNIGLAMVDTVTG